MASWCNRRVASRPACPRALLGIELIDQIHDAVEPGAFPLQHGLAGQCGGQMGLAGARAADEHDVARRAHVFAGVELADPRLVHGRFPEVEAIEVTRHREARLAELVFVGTGLPVRELSLQQLPQPRGRGEFLLTQGRQALLQGAGHAAQA